MGGGEPKRGGGGVGGGAHNWDGSGVGRGVSHRYGGGVVGGKLKCGGGGVIRGVPKLGGGGMGGAHNRDGGGVGGGVSNWHGGGVSVAVKSQPNTQSGGAGGAYEGGLFSSTIESKETASNEQQVKWSPVFVAHLTSLGKWHDFSDGGRLVRPTGLGSQILIKCSAATIHCTGDCALLYNKRTPTPDEKLLIIGDGRKMEVEFFRCADVVMHCAEDVEVTLRNVAFVPGVPFNLYSFKG